MKGLSALADGGYDGFVSSGNTGALLVGATLIVKLVDGVQRTISARLGHALTSTTLNFYIHALRESDQKAADAISSLLEKQP